MQNYQKEPEFSGSFFNAIGNSSEFPIALKNAPLRIRTRAKMKDVASDRARRENLASDRARRENLASEILFLSKFLLARSLHFVLESLRKGVEVYENIVLSMGQFQRKSN